MSDKLKGIVHNYTKIMINTNGDRNTNVKWGDIIFGVLNDGLKRPGYHVYW